VPRKIFVLIWKSYCEKPIDLVNCSCENIYGGRRQHYRNNQWNRSWKCRFVEKIWNLLSDSTLETIKRFAFHLAVILRQNTKNDQLEPQWVTCFFWLPESRCRLSYPLQQSPVTSAHTSNFWSSSLEKGKAVIKDARTCLNLGFWWLQSSNPPYTHEYRELILFVRDRFPGWSSHLLNMWSKLSPLTKPVGHQPVTRNDHAADLDNWIILVF